MNDLLIAGAVTVVLWLIVLTYAAFRCAGNEDDAEVARKTKALHREQDWEPYRVHCKHGVMYGKPCQRCDVLRAIADEKEVRAMEKLYAGEIGAPRGKA